jgi:hypothetical protein
MSAGFKSPTRSVQQCSRRSPAPRTPRCRNRANTDRVHAWFSPTSRRLVLNGDGNRSRLTESVRRRSNNSQSAKIFHCGLGKTQNLSSRVAYLSQKRSATHSLLLSAHRTQDERKDSQCTPRKVLPPAASSLMPVTSNLPIAHFAVVLLTSPDRTSLWSLPIVTMPPVMISRTQESP